MKAFVGPNGHVRMDDAHERPAQGGRHLGHLQDGDAELSVLGRHPDRPDEQPDPDEREEKTKERQVVAFLESSRQYHERKWS